MAARQYAGYAGTRLKHRSAGNLGVVQGQKDLLETYRDKDLDILDAYYEGRQYAGMPSWEDSQAEDGEYLKVRERAPRLNYNFAKVLASRLTSKLLGKKNFPQIKVEDDPQTAEYLNLVLSTSQLRSKLMEPMRRTINTGSCFVRFSIIGGKWKVQHYLSKWCFPEFDETGELEKIIIKYVYDDHEDLDDKGKPIKKWYKLSLNKDKDILYNNPEYKADEQEPRFSVKSTVEHNLGFVQGEWFKSSDVEGRIDGHAIIADILGFIDELNYSLSQTSTAVQYNQDPQLVFSNMDEDEMDSIIRSSVKAWNLGREGKAEFLESDLTGVEAAVVFRDKIKLSIQDISRIVMLDPEKMATHAQSGRAMEVLHGPLVELIEEMQPQLEKHLRSLILKMALTNGVQFESIGISPINIGNYKPKSFNITFSFPDVFPQTAEDLQKKVAVAVNAANASLISRESMTRWLAKDFDIVDVEEELKRIESQPVINPFGAF